MSLQLSSFQRPLAAAMFSLCLLAWPGDRGPLAEEPLVKMSPVKIRIEAGKPFAPISRRLFGKFTEHLGRNIYNDMWAQVLRNPGLLIGVLADRF